MDAERDEAFTAFVTVHRRTLLRSAFLLCGSWADAEDAVQTAMTKLFRAWPRIEHRQGGPEAYARAVVRNAFLDDWRRPWHRWERATCELLEQESPLRVDAADGMALRAALMRLPMRQRQVVVWRYYWGLSQEETAAELGISAGTVKSHSARALARLQSLLRAEAVA